MPQSKNRIHPQTINDGVRNDRNEDVQTVQQLLVMEQRIQDDDIHKQVQGNMYMFQHNP